MTINSYRKHTAYDPEKEKKRTNFIYLNQNCCRKGQTVIAGDSITEMFNMDLLDDYVRECGLAVYNRGISGDTSDRFFERFDETVLSIEPSRLVILIGTNDLTVIDDVDYVFSNIKGVIEKAKSTLPECKIIIQSVYPVDAANKKKNRNIIQLNLKLFNMAEEMGITYIDMHHLLRDSDGGFDERYTYDGLHPNAVGFDIISREVIKALRN